MYLNFPQNLEENFGIIGKNNNYTRLLGNINTHTQQIQPPQYKLNANFENKKKDNAFNPSEVRMKKENDNNFNKYYIQMINASIGPTANFSNINNNNPISRRYQTVKEKNKIILKIHQLIQILLKV